VGYVPIAFHAYFKHKLLNSWLLRVIYFILTSLIFIHQVRGKEGTLTSEPNLLDQNINL